ncbi:MAG: hypothetical protein KME42_09050 [Tildeniella nuda ZEHNDER 1965/U140]|nr:hypothetical protein [Tildeniella nuda ZEHNDER 1965/U140]
MTDKTPASSESSSVGYSLRHTLREASYKQSVSVTQPNLFRAKTIALQTESLPFQAGTMLFQAAAIVL